MDNSYTVVFHDLSNPAERKPLYTTSDIQEAKKVLAEWDCLGHINIHGDGFMSDSDLSMDPNGDAFLRMGEDYGGGTCNVDSLIAFLVRAFPEKIAAAQGFPAKKIMEHFDKQMDRLDSLNNLVDKIAKDMGISFSKVQQPTLDEMA